MDRIMWTKNVAYNLYNGILTGYPNWLAKYIFMIDNVYTVIFFNYKLNFYVKNDRIEIKMNSNNSLRNSEINHF